jgi:hypothetical protein
MIADCTLRADNLAITVSHVLLVAAGICYKKRLLAAAGGW